jgi:hypothetical protein
MAAVTLRAVTRTFDRADRAWRWRALAAIGAVIGAALPAGAARIGAGRAERVLGARTAAAVAGYLATVALPGAGAYDPRSLLVAAFGIGSLRGWSATIEVYAARTPLLMGGGAPLPIAPWQSITSRGATVRMERGSLVPLRNPDQRDVVGGVWVADRPAPWGEGLPITTALVLVTGLSAAWAVGRRHRMVAVLLAAFAGASVASGLVAGAAVRRAAAWSTDRALLDARLLLQDAPLRLDGPPSRVRPAEVARVVEGTGLILGAGDSASADVRRLADEDARRAVTAVRLGPGNWAALHTVPLEASAGRWTALAVGLALLGPAAGVLAHWRARALPRDTGALARSSGAF